MRYKIVSTILKWGERWATIVLGPYLNFILAKIIGGKIGFLDSKYC
jgi:hypothetical protein